MRTILVALALVAALEAQAQVPTLDVGAFMSGLKDEHAECRYLTQLCADYEGAFGAWYQTDLDARETKERRADQERRDADLSTVLDVLAVKHELLPRCVQDCLRNYPSTSSVFSHRWRGQLEVIHDENGRAVWQMPKSLVK